MPVPLNFKELVTDEYKFQELCVAILATQPDAGGRAGLDPYGHWETYGSRGETQHGVDLVARRHDGKWDVGQCKHYRKLTKGQMDAAVEDFMRHWTSHWATWGVVRFILFASCDTDSKLLQDGVIKHSLRLAPINVQFELWGNARITNELRQRSSLYDQYIQVLPGYLEGERNTTVRFERTVSHLYSYSDDSSELFRTRWESKPTREVIREVAQKTGAARLNGHAASEARWIRLHATLLIDSGDADSKTLSAMRARVEHLTPGDPANKRLEARIIDFQGDRDAAITVLESETDPKSALLRASILIQRAGRQTSDAAKALDLEGARELLLRPELARDPDARRLEAVLLMHGVGSRPPSHTSALRVIDESLALRPESWVGRFVKGTILFWSALSPATRPVTPVELPPSGACNLALPTAEAAQRLAEAESLFAQLMLASDISSRCEQAAVWRLMALAAQGAQAAQLHTLARELVSATLPSPILVTYALDLLPQLDIAAVRRICEDRIKAGGDQDLWYQIAFHPRLCPYEDPDAVMKLQELRHEALDRQPQHPVQLKAWWLIQMTNRLMATQRLDEVIALRAEAGSDVRLSKHLQCLSMEQDPNSMISVLSEIVDAHPLALSDLISALVRAERYSEAAEYVPRLVSEVQTLRAYELGLSTAIQADKPDLVLNILHRWPVVKSPEVESQYIWALQQTGQIRVALSKARTLAAREGLSRRAIMHVRREIIRLLLHLGQSQDAINEARELANLCSPAEDGVDNALFIATVLAPELSFRDAIGRVLSSVLDQELSDNQALQLFFLATRLRLDHISAAIGPLLPKLAERNPKVLWRMDLQETADLLRKQREWSSTLLQQWLKAEGPVHLIATRGRGVLPRLYHGIPHAQERHSGAGLAAPLPVFHGGRGAFAHEGETQSTIRGPIVADITSLLLAEHLGMLDRIVSALGPLILPSSILDLLHLIAADLQHPQPPRVIVHKRLVDAAEAGHLKTFAEEGDEGGLPEMDTRRWRRHRAEATKLKAIYFPGNPVARAPGDSDPIMRRHNLIAALRSEIDRVMLEKLHQRMLRNDQSELSESDITPSRGASIVTDTLLLCELAEEPVVLEVFLDRFNVFVSAQDLEVDRRELHEAGEMEELRQWVEGLRLKLADGLASNPPRFRLHELRSTGPEHEEGIRGSVEYRFLTSLLESDMKGVTVWSDDRFINAYRTTSSAPIVTTLDILRSLRVEEAIDKDEYFDKLLRLRRGGFQFIPIGCEELLYHLGSAPVRDGGVMETPELRTLRRTLAKSIVDLGYWQLNCAGEGRQSEFLYLADTVHQVIEALRQVIGRADDASWAHISWLIHALYVEEVYVGSIDIESLDLARCRNLRVAAATKLLASALPVRDANQKADYIKHLWRLFIGQWYDSDAEFQQALIDSVQNYFLSPERWSDREPDFGDCAKVLGCDFFLALPEPLREAVNGRHGLPTKLGVGEVDTFHFEHVGEVDGKSFVEALCAAMRGEKSSVVCESGETIWIECTDAHIKLRSKRGAWVIQDDLMLAACGPDPGRWASFCTERATDLDLPLGDRRTRAAELACLEDPHDRFATWRREVGKTEEGRLRRLDSLFKKQSEVSKSDLEPAEFAQLLSHLRLCEGEANKPWQAVCCQVVERLLEDSDPVDVFFQLAGPQEGLAPRLKEHIANMPPIERGEVLDRIWLRKETPSEITEALHLALAIDPAIAVTYAESLFEKIDDAAVESLMWRWMLGCQIQDRLMMTAAAALSKTRSGSCCLSTSLASIHANRVLRIAGHNSLDPRLLFKQLDQWSRETNTPEFAQRAEADAGEECRHSPVDRFLQLLGLSVGLAAAIPEEVTALLRRQLAPVLATARDQIADCDSYWRRGGLGDVRTLLLKRLAPEMLSEASYDARLDRARALLGRLAVSSEETDSRDDLVRILGDNSVPEALEPDVEGAIRALPTSQEGAIEAFSHLLLWSTRMARRNRGVFTQLEEKLIEIASGGQVPAPQLEFAVRVLSGYSDMNSPIQEYGRIVSRMLDRNPSLAARLAPVILQIALRASAEDAPRVWALVIKMRALADRLDLSLPTDNEN